MGEACRSLFSGGALGLLSCCITVCLLEGIRSQSLARYRERRLQSTTPEKLLRILAPSAAVRLSKRNLCGFDRKAQWKYARSMPIPRHAAWRTTRHLFLREARWRCGAAGTP